MKTTACFLASFLQFLPLLLWEWLIAGYNKDKTYCWKRQGNFGKTNSDWLPIMKYQASWWDEPSPFNSVKSIYFYEVTYLIF